MTHPTWELAVEEGALVLTPCPGTKGTDLLASLDQLKAQGVKAIVTAINAQEMASKGVEALGEQTKQLGMEWHHIVIEDDQAPDNAFAQQWANASPQLQEIIAEGGKVALHCMGGSGRTGLFAAHLLLERQWPLEKIITDVQALRPGAFTKAIQIEYITAIAAR
ncbi:cyclin-dependent kinase inhibitor 3 family protein [Vibrio lamellibrachiae]|uniref:cyclin-dependent kinase inhibitor 3 family protein n=1 Tax=Vibrio lamellibrachiae TaxID=2910253 RepID=UPI003D0F1D6C